eukprot:TRINITY_DN2747_c0_g1_i1.p1 TRINITY_DN2747_c0_g1~~TRINITY_DN2747_c0_g1_i1.p1  ORF type:complete len:1175 (-),score=465.16 TRINITY_DN2747_c0_g1_i1:90-3614(-)
MELRLVYPAKKLDQRITVHPNVNDLRRLVKERLNLQVPCRSIQLSKMERQGGNTVNETRYDPRHHREFIKNLRDSYFQVSIIHNDLGEYMCTGEELGSGAFSQVYRGYKKSNPNENVAIKVIDNQLLTNQKAKEYHENEKKILRILQHPNIVKVHDIVSKSEDNEGIFFYFIMEFCSGGSLESHISGKPLPEATARRCLAQLAQALEHLYQNNIIHRDLKPGNILLTGPDICTATLKLCDFGFSRFFAPNELMQSFPLSPLYASPQLLFQRPYDPRSDLWSVGVIFYEMLTGGTLFKEVQTMDQLHKAINNQNWRISIPPEIRQNLSSECISLVHLLLERDDTRRISWEQFFKHPFLQSVSTRGIFNSGDGEGYEVLVGEHTNVLSLKNALAPTLRIPEDRQVILLEDEKGTELTNHTILSTMGKAWELRTPMYLYDTKAGDQRKSQIDIPSFPIENFATSPFIVSSSDSPIRILLEILKDFEHYSQKLKNTRKACEKTVSYHRSITKPMRNQIKSLNVMKSNFFHVTRSLESEVEQYTRLFEGVEKKISFVLKEFPLAAEKIKKISMAPSLCRNGINKSLWDAIEGSKYLAKFEKLKLLYEDLSKWFIGIKSIVTLSKDYSNSTREIDERALSVLLKNSEELAKEIDSAIMVCDQDHSKVIKETETERNHLQNGLSIRTDIYECFKTMLDSCRLQLERAEEAHKTIHTNFSNCFISKHSVAVQIQSAIQFRMKNLEILREIPTKAQRLVEMCNSVQILIDQFISLPSSYQNYLEEMTRRGQFEDNLLKKAEQFKDLFDSLTKEESSRLLVFNKNHSRSLNTNIFVGLDRVEQKNISITLPERETASGFSDVIKSYYQQGKYEDFDNIMAEFEGTDASQLRSQNQDLRSKLLEKERELEEFKKNDFLAEAVRLRTRILKIEEERNLFHQQYELRFEELKRKANSSTPQSSPSKSDANLVQRVNELSAAHKDAMEEIQKWKSKYQSSQNELKTETDSRMDLFQRLETEMKSRQSDNIEVQNLKQQLGRENAERVKEGLKVADLSKKLSLLELELSEWKSKASASQPSTPNSNEAAIKDRIKGILVQMEALEREKDKQNLLIAQQQEEMNSRGRAVEISHKEMMETISGLNAKLQLGNSVNQKLEALLKLTKMTECPFCSEFLSENLIQAHIDEKH